MIGGAAQTALTGVVLILGGAIFARMGWRALLGREAAGAPSGAAAPAAAPLGWKLLYAFSLLFGGFVFVCGLLLAFSLFIGE